MERCGEQLAAHDKLAMTWALPCKSHAINIWHGIGHHTWQWDAHGNGLSMAHQWHVNGTSMACQWHDNDMAM
eukprot:11185866-Lingulodinium_polyedra.AAC.1